MKLEDILAEMAIITIVCAPILIYAWRTGKL